MKVKDNATLAERFDTTVVEASQRVAAFPWGDRLAYQCWLAQTYYLVRHTTRLLCLAAARTPIDSREIHYRFIEHLGGETHHDRPLIKDLGVLGATPGDFPELPETRLIVHNQYYWLDRGDVTALSGYALFLEGLSVHTIPGIISRLNAAEMGGASSFLKLHHDSDQDHYPEGLAWLQTLTQETSAPILSNLEESAILYVRMYDRIEEHCAARRDGSNRVSEQRTPQATKIKKAS